MKLHRCLKDKLIVIYYPFKDKSNVFYLKTHCVPLSKHVPSLIETNRWVLCVKNFAVFSEIQDINILCGQNVEFLNLKTSGKYTNG
jgi:hypothetical protein